MIKLNDFDHLEDIDLFQKFVAIYIRRNGLSRILIYEFPSDKEQNLTNGKLNELHVPHEISEISSAQNLDIKSDLFNFSCSVIGKHESTYTCNYSDLSISTKKIVGFHNISTDNYMLKHGFIQIPHNNRNNQTLLNIPCTFAHHISVDFPFDLDKDFIFRSKNNLQPTSLLLEVYGNSIYYKLLN